MRAFVLALLVVGALGGCAPHHQTVIDEPGADMQYLDDLARHAAERCATGPNTEGPFTARNFKGSKAPGTLNYEYRIESGCSEGVRPKQAPSGPTGRRSVVVVPSTERHYVPVPTHDYRYWGESGDYHPRHRRY